MPEGKPFIRSGELFDCLNPFEEGECIDLLFKDSMNEALHWHLANCNDYKAFLSENGLVDNRLQYMPEQIPPILTDIFKKYKLLSVPEKQIKYNITSKTTNDFTENKLILDARSHKRILKIYEKIFDFFGFVEHTQKVNYLCFTYDSKYETELNGNFYFNIITDLTAHRSVYYAIRYNKKTSDFNFDLEAAAKKIIDFSCHAEPVRIIGSSYYLKQICEWFETHDLFLKLNNKSCVFIIDEPEIIFNNNSLKNRIEKLFDILNENIRRILIFPYQGIPYIECKNGCFHMPVYAKAVTFEPESLVVLDDGYEGILGLMTPYLTSSPGISLLTSYKSVIEDCHCGIGSKTFRIIDSGIK